MRNYTFESKEKTFALGLMVVGGVLAGIGIALNLDSPARIWSALLYNNLFYLYLGLIALFYIASQTLGYNGWYVVMKRAFEAMTGYIVVGSLLMIPILYFGLHDLYHWTHEYLYDRSNPAYDPILDRKSWYLNVPGFWIRTIVYLGLWVAFAFIFRRNSLASDKGWDLNVYNRSRVLSSIFVVIFGVSSSMAMWDWLMSIQPHWYSTLFGWYCFISIFVTSMAVMTLLLQFLKSRGLMPDVSEEHFHDLGKYMFAFSVAWAYLFFSQFMLIWYSNIPEELSYYMVRIERYPHIMWACVGLNFVAPFLILVSKGAKRTTFWRTLGAVLIIFGHWLDYYQMAVPGALESASHGAHAGGHDHAHGAAYAAAEHGHHAAHAAAEVIPYSSGHVVEVGSQIAFGPGPLELGLGIFYAGLFIFVVLWNLSRAPLYQVNHPFYKESLIHHT